MTVYSGQITQMIQGVSQQHPKDRAEGQIGEQVNCISDIVEGLRRRPALKMLSELTDIGTSFTLNDYTAYYAYARGDGIEEYIMLFDTLGRVKVYNAITGVACTVGGSTGATYLQSSNPKENLRFHTIGDTTFILNKGITALMDSATSPALGYEALIYCEKASYGHTYKVLIDDVVEAEATVDSTVTLSIGSSDQDVDKSLTLNSTDLMAALVLGKYNEQITITKYLYGETETYTATAGQTDFPAEVDLSVATILVSVNSVPKSLGTDYLISAQSIVFTSGLSAGDIVTIDVQGEIGGTITGTDWDVTLKEDVAWIEYDSAFGIAVSDGNHNADFKAVKSSVSAFAELPLYAPHGYKIAIMGTGEQTYDDYWVKWVADDTSPTFQAGTGHWQECIGPGVELGVDEDTMPMKIARTGVNTFTVSTNSWVDRAAGDADTNPDPSFIDTTISDIGSYQNRLFFLTEENVFMSRAYDHLALFSESVAEGADDDPVDSASSDNQITDLLHAVVFGGDLVLFSNNAQFIHSGDIPVKPSTFAVASATQFSASPSTKPVATGSDILFPTDFGDYTNVWEYKLNTTTGKPACESITKNLPRYLEGNPEKMLANTTTDYALLLTDESRAAGVVYVMQFYVKNGEKVQLAWHKWNFEDATINAVMLLEQKVLVVLSRNSSVYLEYLDLSLPLTDNSNFELYLDHYYTTQVTSGTYLLGLNEYNARFAIEESNIDTFVQGDGATNEGFILDEADYEISGGYVYCNQPAGAYIIQGYPYESYGTLTNPYVKDYSGRPYTKETIIEEVTFNVQKTAWVELTVTHHAGDDYTEIFNGQVLNDWQYLIGQASEYNTDIYVPVQDYRELVELSFFSDHHLGFALMSMEWVADMETRGRRSS